MAPLQLKIEEALDTLKQYSREVIEKPLAEEIAQAFGYSLGQLDIKGSKLKDFPRLNYDPKHANKICVSVYHLARELAEWKTGEKVYSNMNGQGSFAQDVTEKSVEMLKEKATA